MPKTHVTFLLDRSGSMAQILDDTIGGFNTYLDAIRDTPDLFFTLTTFDSNSADRLCERVPVKEAPRLTKDNFVPRGGTPLVDAFCDVIKRASGDGGSVFKPTVDGDKFKNIADEIFTDAKEQVVVTVLTDGEENQSTRYSSNDLAAMIKEKTEAGWQFNYLGASIDAYKMAAKFGISGVNTMSFNSMDVAASEANYRSLGSRTVLYASGAMSNMNISEKDKKKAGDKFAPKPKGL